MEGTAGKSGRREVSSVVERVEEGGDVFVSRRREGPGAGAGALECFSNSGVLMQARPSP